MVALIVNWFQVDFPPIEKQILAFLEFGKICTKGVKIQNSKLITIMVAEELRYVKNGKILSLFIVGRLRMDIKKI